MKDQINNYPVTLNPAEKREEDASQFETKHILRPPPSCWGKSQF